MFRYGVHEKKFEELRAVALEIVEERLKDLREKDESSIRDHLVSQCKNLKSAHVGRNVAGIINVLDYQYWLEDGHGDIGPYEDMKSLYGERITKAVYDTYEYIIK